MDRIIDQILNNFDLAYMLAINILTYIAIKVHDYFNGNKKVSMWMKRIYLVISIIIVTILYIMFADIQANVLINSAIAAPVFWSWILKPLVSKTKFDYKQIDDTLK